MGGSAKPGPPQHPARSPGQCGDGGLVPLIQRRHAVLQVGQPLRAALLRDGAGRVVVVGWCVWVVWVCGWVGRGWGGVGGGRC
jgi:hypothetical protein